MSLDLFAGAVVSDRARAITWYDRLLGDVETFDPNDVERVWTLTDGRHLYVEERPEGAGGGLVTLFVGDYDAFVSAAADRGVVPANEETYENGVRKATYHDPDGNEIGVGGGPSAADEAQPPGHHPGRRAQVSALAINVTIPEDLRWTDERRGQVFELQTLNVRLLPNGSLAAKAYGRPLEGGRGGYVSFPIADTPEVAALISDAADRAGERWSAHRGL